MKPESEIEKLSFEIFLCQNLLKKISMDEIISVYTILPILSVGLTGEGTSLSWYGKSFSTAVNPRKGFKMTPARKALESSGPDVKARSRTLPNFD